VLESGGWEHSGDRIRFVPKDKKKESYTAGEVSHNRRTLLAFRGDGAPTLAIPIEQIKRRIDANPKELPSYVFFEIDRATYERKTKETYPFRTRDVQP
jgi:hypothetical protein